MKCSICDNATCKTCRAYIRQFRQAVLRAADMPAFAAKLRLVGEVRSEPTARSPDGAIREGALPADKRVEGVLMSVSRAVQGVRRAG